RTNVAGDIPLEINSIKAGAISECIVPDAGDAVGDRDIGQAATGIERILADVDDAIGNRVASAFAPRALDERGLALVEQDPSHTTIVCIVCSYRYCRQAGAGNKRQATD